MRNIETKTGKSLAELRTVVAKSGLTKVGEVRAMLIERFGLGYGDANALALAGKAPTTSAVTDDPLATIYSGAKAALRPLHEQVMVQIHRLGEFEIAPKKAYLSLWRKKQFAMLGPATQTQIELGLNAKGLPADPRLKAMPSGGMCQYTVRLSAPGEVDAKLVGWLRAAYDAAG